MLTLLISMAWTGQVKGTPLQLESILPSLQKIVDSKAVAFVRGETDKKIKTGLDDSETFTFLDSKAAILGQFTATENLREFFFSPNGKEALVQFVDISNAPRVVQYDYVVVNSDGLVANLHSNSISSATWDGENVLLSEDRKAYLWGPESGSKQWVLNPAPSKFQNGFVDGDTIWSEAPKSPSSKERVLTQYDRNGEVICGIPTGVKEHEVILRPPQTSLIFLSSHYAFGDGWGGIDRLEVWDIESGRSLVISSSASLSKPGQWLAKPHLFVFPEADKDPTGIDSKISFFSPATGRSFTFGKHDLFLPSVVPLDDEIAIVTQFGGHVLYLMDPAKRKVKELRLDGVPAPTQVQRCRL